MRITSIEMTKIDAFLDELRLNAAAEAIYILPYTSVRGKDIISVVAIVDKTKDVQMEELENIMKRYKTNVGLDKVLTFSLDSKENYDIENESNNLKALASGGIIFDRYGEYRILKAKLDYEYLNRTRLEKKSPIKTKKKETNV